MLLSVSRGIGISSFVGADMNPIDSMSCCLTLTHVLTIKDTQLLEFSSSFSVILRKQKGLKIFDVVGHIVEDQRLVVSSSNGIQM
jgi:hypothetical protein